MGLLTGSKKKVSAQGALVLAMMAMILVDGNADDDELAVLERIINNANADESADELDNLYDTYEYAELIELIANSLDANQRKTVIANLLDVAMADGILGENEKELLVIFIMEFQMDSSDVDNIIDVIAAKNRAL